jgi:NAD(P)-dependent dehydrogenase (short-subunit alcohol dehydrogenase family)
MIGARGNTVLVTGAARGLGRGIARVLMAQFDTVVCADKDFPAATATAAELGAGCMPVAMDITDSGSVNAAFASVIQNCGSITALVNNAGVMGTARVVDCTDAQWDEIAQTNLRGAFFCSRVFARHRIALGGGGSLVNIVSAAAESARAGAAAYSASKAGIVMLTKTLAIELGKHDITVNAVAPGLLKLPDRETDEKYRAKYLGMVPLGRLGTVEDIGYTVRFLLSNEARYVHGTTMSVDGGFLAGRPITVEE